jgi:hypothetical protein
MTEPESKPERSEGALEEEPHSVAQLIGQVSRRIGAIAKDRRAKMGDSGGTYQFRGIDDVMDAVHGPLAEAGIVTLTEVVDVERHERPRPNKSPQTIVYLRLRVHFVGPRGDVLTAEAEGEGQDYGDKATPKAHSVAFRTIMLQAFTIPVSDSSAHVDSEIDNEEREPEPPTVDLLAYAKQELSAAEFAAMAEAWKADGHSFGPGLVPLEREQEFRTLIDSYVGSIAENPPQEGA